MRVDGKNRIISDEWRVIAMFTVVLNTITRILLKSNLGFKSVLLTTKPLMKLDSSIAFNILLKIRLSTVIRE